MLNILLPIGSLFAGIALLLLGSGLLNTLLAIRGGLEGFSEATLGIIGSAYFGGFFLGTFIAPGLIRRIGHVRAFAFFGAVMAVCFLLHPLFINAAFWITLRVVTGIALVGFYAVIESWLNSEAPPERRGQVFAVYMAVNLIALGAAQQLLVVSAPTGFTLFILATIFVCLSLLPVTVTRLPAPEMHDTPHPDLRRLWKAAPVAFVGATCSGLAMGAFWSMTPVYAQRIGLIDSDIGLLMSLAILGGALLQWPLGRFSDSRDRRMALAWIAAGAALSGALFGILGFWGQAAMIGGFLFGATAFAIYPVVVAHLIDHLPQNQILAGNAGILLLHGLGAAIGPAVAGLLMAGIGSAALPLHFTVSFAALAAFSALHARKGRDEIVDEPAHFVAMLRTSPSVLEMMSPPDHASPSHDEPAAAER